MERIKLLKAKRRDRYKGINRKCFRLTKKVRKLENMVKNIKEKCAAVEETILNKAISNLPLKQKHAVKACFEASKLKDMKSMRYTTQWIYECFLMRVKSKKLYTQLRRDKILSLPSPRTLSRYMQNIKATYGFQSYVFEGLKMKTPLMSPMSRRGIFAIDEVKLSEALAFDRLNLKVEGFTDLGPYTPDYQKKQRGDHALVIMFQPFVGNSVQTIGCFLSRGCVKGKVLSKIILEGLALAEKSGLFIDAVVTDGATWNRSMWTAFGISEKKKSVPHPCDSNRRLWFLSDYPHLAKILRNFVTNCSKYDIIYTPDGPISKKHWYALVELLNKEPYSIKINYKLRKEHIDPKYYQKMNVALAIQFFNIYPALEIYENRHVDLEDCEGTKAFCKRISALNKAMNSRTPGEAMAPSNEFWKTVEDFIKYLEEWETFAKKNNYQFLTDNCCYGLKISLQAALEICQFLVTKCDFKYLMTGRLNQDCLERFFGMMRECCGANDHPDSILFIQMYKLVSTYSLIKPPKGSNVEGSDILDSLLQLKDIEDESQRKEQWEGMIDTIIDKGGKAHLLGEASSIILEHNYSMSETSEYAFTYIAGYCSRRSSRFTKFLIENKKPVQCSDCVNSLSLTEKDVLPERHKLIDLKSKGFLKHPSLQLYDLITILETATLNTVKNNDVHADTLLQITETLEELSPLPFIGCVEHSMLLTRRIVIFYLTMRMFFITKQYNIVHNEAREKTKEKRKAAKLSVEASKELSSSDLNQHNFCDSVNPAYKQKVRRKRKSPPMNSKINKKKKTDSKPEKRKLKEGLPVEKEEKNMKSKKIRI